jgi:pyruvate dehydrogenase E1 component alpha subunit/2-oxoisovalerate dehydrogenase E1 component alpha subunit
MSEVLTNEQQLNLYYFMKLNREVEAAMERLFKQNKIVGGLYASLGQEAISVGTASALVPGDWIAPMIRNIGALLTRGVPPRDIFTQHMARFTSPTKGKDGTSHFGDLKGRHIVSPISMLGDLIPVMAGVGIGARYLGQKVVTMTWIGDGGSSTGAFHEGLMFAAMHHAPMVLIVENNQWAYSTPVNRQTGIRDIADRAQGYGIQGVIVDGNDVREVYRVTKQAVERARSGGGPVLIEAKTMRMRGHAQHDSAEYVPKEMFAYWKERDPIPRYEKYLTENAIWDAKKKADVDARIEKLVREDREFAENSPFPPPELAEQGVYCDGCHTIEPEWKREKPAVSGGYPAAHQVKDYGEFRPAAVAAAAVAPAAVVRADDLELSEEMMAAGPNGKAPIAEETALRVPFGRGPKDKAFREEQAAKTYSRGGSGKTYPQNKQQQPHGKLPGKVFTKPFTKPFTKEFTKAGQGASFQKGPHQKPGSTPRKNFVKHPADKAGRA